MSIHPGHDVVVSPGTSTVGRFDYVTSISTNAVGASGKPLEIHNAFESALPAAQKTAASAVVDQQDDIIKFISDELGVPFPFDSHGVVLHRGSFGFTALEVQTKLKVARISLRQPPKPCDESSSKRCGKRAGSKEELASHPSR